MDRRNFLQAMAAAAASLEVLGGSAVAADSGLMTLAKGLERPVGTPVSTDGYTLVCEFKPARRAMEGVRGFAGARWIHWSSCLPPEKRGNSPRAQKRPMARGQSISWTHAEGGLIGTGGRAGRTICSAIAR